LNTPVSDLLGRRRSVRSFLPRSVETGILDQIFAAAARAPSGGNIQPWSIVCITEPDRRARLCELVGNQPWVRNAPVTLLFCIDFHRTRQWARIESAPYQAEQSLTSFLIAYADVYCAAHNVTIAAEDLGLGTVYVGTVLSSIPEIRRAFALPELVVPIVALCVGYPRRRPAGIPKLAVEALVHREQYRTAADDQVRQWYLDKYGDLDQTLTGYFERTYQEIREIEDQEKPGSIEQVRRIVARLEIANSAQFLFKFRYPGSRMKLLNQPLWDALQGAGFRFDVT
jgi:nitroreductase